MIKFNGVCKSFGEKAIVHNCNWEFGEGVTFLVGDTGKGKTTIMKMIMGLEQADSGSVETKGKISPVFQEDRLLENTDIENNVRYVSDAPLNMELVCELELTEYLGVPVRKLSGGTKRRVALLRALSVDFDILLLDEPFTGLDVSIKSKTMDVIRKYTAGKQVVISTHDKDALKYMGDKAKIIEVI